VPRVGATELDVFPLCLGCNVFGWTADEEAAFAVLDTYAAAGGNFLDTADVYPPPGDSGGQSEEIIGRWLQARGNRDRIVIATKVGRMPGLDNLRADTIRTAIEGSLRRLQIDCIDLYYAHGDDHPEIPLDETLAAFDELVRAGKARYIAASNYEPPRLAEALAVSKRDGLAAYVALQPEYNLLEREYERELQQICAAEHLSCVPYFSLAWGFLTGKYRPDGQPVDSPRRDSALQYLNKRGLNVLAALDQVAADHTTTAASVALSWLRAQPTVAAPIASARNPAQLAELLPMADLQLQPAELSRLNTASESSLEEV
jgi:aryl-alcohol dehydrogenase-like predicted oxidoreductase